MVYYRKYRPQLISELDLSSVREKLSAILLSKSIPHAFLFAGPKGLGKTSSARILAKAINCEKRKTGEVEPCNICSACISITQGSAVDVLEIDAASNRGIDEIRDLRERIKFSPSSLKKKIYIIDEVHMLTTEAFNALLKTLEEPPAHVVFILATTEIGKLPGTILSRVFLVQFEKPSDEELARSLTRIVTGEDLKLEDSVIKKVSELSDGAFRDGAKILEELSLQSKGKKITLSLVDSLYKTGSIDLGVEELVNLGLQKNIKEALKTIDNLSKVNTDFKLVIEKMANNLHTKLLESVASDNTKHLEDIKKFLDVLDEAYKGLKGAVLPQLPLEIALIEFGIENEAKDAPHVQAIVQKKEEVIQITTTQQEPALPTTTKPEVNLGENIELFRKLVDSVNVENKILAGLLRGCRIEEVEESVITVKAPSVFHLGKLTEKQNNALIAAHLQKIMHKEVAITFKS